MKRVVLITVLVFAGAFQPPAERINHEGRILGPLPTVTNSILFNTTNADIVVAAMQIFPVTDPWNEDISRRPLLANSSAMIAQTNTTAIFNAPGVYTLMLSADNGVHAVAYDAVVITVPPVITLAFTAAAG